MRQLKSVIYIWHIDIYLPLYICTPSECHFFLILRHPSACHLDENWLRYKIIIMTPRYSGNWYLFCHCIYLCTPSEWHFFSDFNAPKHMLFGSKLSEIWGIHFHFRKRKKKYLWVLVSNFVLKSAQKDHSDGVCELCIKQIPISTFYATFRWAISNLYRCYLQLFHVIQHVI